MVDPNVEVKLQSIADEQAALRKVLESLTGGPTTNSFGNKSSTDSTPLNVIVPKGPGRITMIEGGVKSMKRYMLIGALFVLVLLGIILGLNIVAIQSTKESSVKSESGVQRTPDGKHNVKMATSKHSLDVDKFLSLPASAHKNCIGQPMEFKDVDDVFHTELINRFSKSASGELELSTNSGTVLTLNKGATPQIIVDGGIRHNISGVQFHFDHLSDGLVTDDVGLAP